MPGKYTGEYDSIYLLILFAMTCAVFTVTISYSPNKQDSTYAEDQCSRDKLEHRQSVYSVKGNGAKTVSTQRKLDQKKDIEKPYTQWCDLAAQQAVANATRRTEWTAWIVAVCTVIGMVVLFGTLFYTRRTLYEMRSIGRNEIRAYVSGIESTFELNSKKLHCFLNVKNFGQSPCYNLRGRNVKIWWEFVNEAPKYLKNTEGKTLNIPDLEGGTVAAGTKRHLTFRIIETPGADFCPKDFLDYGKMFYISCNIEWTDVFGDVGKCAVIFISPDLRSMVRYETAILRGDMTAQNTANAKT